MSFCRFSPFIKEEHPDEMRNVFVYIDMFRLNLVPKSKIRGVEVEQREESQF